MVALSTSRAPFAASVIRATMLSVFNAEQVQVDQPMHRPTIQEAKDLRKGKRCAVGAHERRTDGFASEQRHAAAIELPSASSLAYVRVEI